MGRRFTGRTLVALLVAALCLWLDEPLLAQTANERIELSVGAEAAVLMDSTDGRILWSHDPTERRAIASTTKIVTALVVLEETEPEERVKVSSAAEAIGATDPLVSEIDLVAGESLTVGELLYALLLPSANDAAIALAEHVSGSVKAFVGKMNAAAQELGAVGSRFTNPHGLDDPGHYSTARDLALFTKAAMKFPLFSRIIATQQASIPGGADGTRELANRNTLLASYQGADGVKTGQTRASGRSLVASATRGTERLIAVALASPDPAADARKILDTAFSRFRRVTVIRKGDRWGTETMGDGRTLDLIAVSTVSFLAVRGAEVREDYVARDRVLRVQLGSGTDAEKFSVALRSRCGACVQQPAGRAAVAVWSLLRPAALLLAGFR